MKKTNYFFKCLFAVVAVLFSVATISAQTAVTSIAELRTLEDGTKVSFSGKAMTTMHLTRDFSTKNGIFIQDESGAVFLSHKYFNEKDTYFDDNRTKGYKMNEGGTEVLSFVGTFKKATSLLPDRIEFTDSEIVEVKSGTSGNSIPYVEITAEDLLANTDKYDSWALAVIDNVTKTGDNFYATTYSFSNSTTQIPVSLGVNIAGKAFPAAGTFHGVCTKYREEYKFFIPNRYYIEPTKFFSFVDLYNFVDDINSADISATEIEILDPVLVNYVAQMPTVSNYYVQSTNNAIPAQTVGVCISVPSRQVYLPVQAGDSINGLKGYYSKYKKVEGGVAQGSMFRVHETNFSNIKVVNSSNELTWAEAKVYDVLLTPHKYESRILSLPVGKFETKKLVEAGLEVERTIFVQYDGELRKQYDTIYVQMAGGKTLDAYIGKEYAVMGILDLSEAISMGYPTILLRDEDDILRDREFESIGAMLAEGRPRSTKVTYTLKNPVVVTYQYHASGQSEDMCGLYLQDATGAILLKTENKVEGVQVGDSVTGVYGKLQYDPKGHQEHYLKNDTEGKITLTVKNSNNVITPRVATLDQIVADPMGYASHYVKLEGLETTYKFGFSQGYPYETEFIYQNGATMNVVWDNIYENMMVEGVVEYGIMGHGLTIFPVKVEDTTKPFDGTCRRIKDIKSLAAGTEFTYVGDATTTFTDYGFGILIQDYTGGILLKNAKLGDGGDGKIKSGMLITNIKGKYQPESGNDLPSIEVADADIEAITIKNAEADFECYPTDVNVVKEFYDKYLMCEAISFRKPEIEETDKGYKNLVFRYYLQGSNTEIPVRLPIAEKGVVDFTKEELVGYARRINGNLVVVLVGEGTSDFPSDLFPVDVESVVLNNDIFMSAEGELFAPQATSVVVYDINGRMVAIGETSYMNLSSLNRGVYVVRCAYADGSFQTTKVVR